jgi:hypothetical protein
MPRFHFITAWSVDATVEEVYQIIKDSSRLGDWWPSVYLDVKVIDEGFPNGIGKKVALWTKGFLPYTLRWTFEVVQIIPNERIVIEPSGDFTGKGIWTFSKTARGANANYDWDINFDKKYLAAFTPLLRPIFAWNHRWAMSKGLESLNLEILRRRGEKNVSPPPRATWPHGR